MTDLTIQELTEFVDYFEKLKKAGEKDLLPIRMAKQLLATMQREAKLRNVLAYVTDMAEAYIRQIGGVKHPQQSEYLREARMLAKQSEYSVGSLNEDKP